MAVEAHHQQHLHRYFPAQIVGNREKINIENNNENINMGFGIPLYLAEALQINNPSGANILTYHNSDLNPAMNTAVFSDHESGLTCNNNNNNSNNNNISVLRKRGRDYSNSFPAGVLQQRYRNLADLSSSPVFPSNFLSFLGEDISVNLQHQQLEIDRFITLHAEKVRTELQETRRRQSRRLLATVEQGVVKKLKAKEEEIEKIGKMNWVLEEKLNSLYIENQFWQNLARENEATANALRNNLEQALAQVKEEGLGETGEDAHSCCNSSNGGEEKEGEVKKGEEKREMEERSCRNCRKNRSCVLLLPCRHLCLCTVCSSRLHTCPICKSIKDASVHVNLS